MKVYTWLELKTEVLAEMDMEDEDFITSTEMLVYGNNAVDEAEDLIHSLYADYFKTSAALSMVDGTATYSLPSDIYGCKIRWIQYDDGTNKYKVERIKFEDIPNVEDNDDYQYDIINTSAATGYQIKLYPAARDTTSSQITIWYLRNATYMTGDSSKIDIPEAVSFIKNYIKMKIAQKETHPLLQVYTNDYEQSKARMMTTLSEMTVDENDLDQDLSFYDDMN